MLYTKAIRIDEGSKIDIRILKNIAPSYNPISELDENIQRFKA